MKYKILTEDFSKNLKQFIKFNIVGVINTTIDFAVFTLLTCFGMYYIFAQILSYTCGIINSYLLNRFWTFGQYWKFEPVQIIKFIIVNLFSLGISLLLLYLFKDVLEFHIFISKILATAGSVIINFSGNRLWVFRKGS